MLKETCHNYCQEEEAFKLLEAYNKLNLSALLKDILSKKKVGIVDLHERLQLKGYYLNIESLYRYFNPSVKSNRLPSEEFIKVFAEALELTEEQSDLLLQFWTYFKFLKKHK